MKAHLKTIGIILLIIGFIYCFILYPVIVFKIISSTFIVSLVYGIIYAIVTDEVDDDELSGPFNAGGRERD
jgi:hypothetical protein